MYVRIISSSRPIVETKYPLAQNLWPRKLRNLRCTFCAIQIELFPFRYPITSDTEYFGGVDISMCTWSAIKCPSSIWHSLRWASSRNTLPKCRRICPNSNFLRYFGVNTTWYLHSHVPTFRTRKMRFFDVHKAVRLSVWAGR